MNMNIIFKTKFVHFQTHLSVFVVVLFSYLHYRFVMNIKNTVEC